MRAPQITKHAMILILSAVGLAACGGDMDDLDQYINETVASRLRPKPTAILTRRRSDNARSPNN